MEGLTPVLTPDFWPTMGVNIGLIAVYAVIGAVLMYVGYFAIDLTTPGDLRGLVREGRPNAVVVSAAGMVSMAFIVVTAIYVSGGGFLAGILNTSIYGLVGIIAQADLVVYADSLVDSSVAAMARKPAARVVGSSGSGVESGTLARKTRSDGSR